jgi:hypothetical protein
MAMRKLMILAGTVLALSFGSVASAADPTSTNEIVAGEVTKIDKDSGRVTVRSKDGKLHEFEASKETLADLEPGDHIEARKRPGT